jgi:hypothetical protein
VKTVKLRCPARSRNHGPEKNDVWSALFDCIDHLLVVEAERPAVEDRNIRGFFLADEARDLRVQRVDSQMALAPRRPIAHWGCHKQEFHEIS